VCWKWWLLLTSRATSHFISLASAHRKHSSMHSPPKNRSQGWMRRIKTATMAKKILFFCFPIPVPYHATAGAPRLVAAQLLFSGEIGLRPPRIAGSLSISPQIFPDGWNLIWFLEFILIGILIPMYVLPCVCAGFVVRQAEASRSNQKDQSCVPELYHNFKFGPTFGSNKHWLTSNSRWGVPGEESLLGEVAMAG